MAKKRSTQQRDEAAKKRRIHNLPKGPKGRSKWKQFAKRYALDTTHVDMLLRLAISPAAMSHRAAQFKSDGRDIRDWIAAEY